MALEAIPMADPVRFSVPRYNDREVADRLTHALNEFSIASWRSVSVFGEVFDGAPEPGNQLGKLLNQETVAIKTFTITLWRRQRPTRAGL